MASQKLGVDWPRKAMIFAGSAFKEQVLTYLLENGIAGLPYLFHHGLGMKNFRQQTVEIPLAHKKHHYCYIRILFLQLLVQMKKRFQCKVKTFILEFKAAGSEEIDRLVEVEAI